MAKIRARLATSRKELAEGRIGPATRLIIDKDLDLLLGAVKPNEAKEEGTDGSP
jgi:hypothetical protein